MPQRPAFTIELAGTDHMSIPSDVPAHVVCIYRAVIWDNTGDYPFIRDLVEGDSDSLRDWMDQRAYTIMDAMFKAAREAYIARLAEHLGLVS